MHPTGKTAPGKGSLELIEEATQALRTAPLSALGFYYIGSAPFVLAALYFWGDMSQSAFAGRHLAQAALGLALLFVWMKVWQARFAGEVRAVVAAGASVTAGPPRGSSKAASNAAKSLPRLARVLVSQLGWQPLGLFLLSVATILTLPFAWVYAFVQNLTVLADLDTVPPRSLARKAAHLAVLWPKQNHSVLLILSGFGLFVFLNLATVVYLLPGLIKMLVGVESVFTRSGMSLLNSTFFAVIAGLTYLCVDPLAKSVYVLRCFYGESLESGEDLKADLRQASGALVRVAVGLLVCACLFDGRATESRGAFGMRCIPPFLEAPESGARQTLRESAAASRDIGGNYRSSPAAELFAVAFPGYVAATATDSGVPPADLDEAIRRTIQQRKYTWRAPRERIQDEDEGNEGLLSRFFERARKLFRGWAKAAANWVDKMLRKLFGPSRPTRPTGSSYGWMVWSQMLLYLLIAAAVAGLGWLSYRVWRERRRSAPTLAGEPIQPPPDLADQNVGAEQLPEDGWTKLGRELMARGEWRLAIRAFYLASLAHLAGRHLINLAKFKSNREYELELRRRAHSLPQLLVSFGETVSIFDRVWYGRQPIDGELARAFAANVDRVKAATGI